MLGDAEVMGSKARGGNDTFVFLPGSGNDTVCDFRHGEDVIDLAAYGVSAISELEIEIIDGNSVVHLGTQNSSALVGVSQLSDSDFLFA